LTWGSIMAGTRPQAQQNPTMSYAQNDGYRAPSQYTNPGGQPYQYSNPGGQPSQYTNPGGQPLQYTSYGGQSQYQRGPTPASPNRYQSDLGTSQRNTYPSNSSYTTPSNPPVRQTSGVSYQQSPKSYTSGSTRNYTAAMNPQPSYTSPSNRQQAYARPANSQSGYSPSNQSNSQTPQSYTPANAPRPAPPTYQRTKTIEANTYYQEQGITQSKSPVYSPPNTSQPGYNPVSSKNTQHYPDAQATSSLLEARNASPYYQASL
jgi:hypothetical protein